MAISLKLQKFEGPLELLLHLIDKNKVDIFDIPIVEITNQYMDYLHAMEQEDMAVLSDFLVMAATLLDIKARMLLPKEVNEEGEEEDPRQELVERLLEYKMYQYMAGELRDRQMDAEKVLYKEATVPEEVEQYRPPVNLDELLKDVDLERLSLVFQDVIRRQESRIDPVRSKFGNVEKEEVNLDETIAHVEDYIARHKKCSFRSLIGKKKSRMQVIVTFLTVLEMMKTGKITVEQDGIFSDIRIAANGDGESTPAGERDPGEGTEPEMTAGQDR